MSKLSAILAFHFYQKLRFYPNHLNDWMLLRVMPQFSFYPWRRDCPSIFRYSTRPCVCRNCHDRASRSRCWNDRPVVQQVTFWGPNRYNAESRRVECRALVFGEPRQKAVAAEGTMPSPTHFQVPRRNVGAKALFFARLTAFWSEPTEKEVQNGKTVQGCAFSKFLPYVYLEVFHTGATPSNAHFAFAVTITGGAQTEIRSPVCCLSFPECMCYCSFLSNQSCATLHLLCLAHPVTVAPYGRRFSCENAAKHCWQSLGSFTIDNSYSLCIDIHLKNGARNLPDARACSPNCLHSRTRRSCRWTVSSN